MCGISGTIQLQVAATTLVHQIQRSTDAMLRRGPDDQGHYISPPVALGQRRLSIIDLSPAGHQPMMSPDGRYALVFNGEFFNFNQHRKSLIDGGITFNGESDTEVLLHLLIREGLSALEKVNGFFALAFCDLASKRLWLARDRYGVKPVYYSTAVNRFAFASEIKALLPLIQKPSINRTALRAYLQLNYIPHPLSIFEDVYKLEPGQAVYIDYTTEMQCKKDVWYTLPPFDSDRCEKNYDKACKKLFTLLSDSVERRMISDVPLGTFLSGGLDSSIVSALAARQTRELNTFSIGFADRPFYDESDYAVSVSKKIGSRHHVFSLTDQDLMLACENVLEYTDEPFADSSGLNLFILSRETRKHVTVVLSGDGADELFGGYRKHQAEARIREDLWQDRLLNATLPLLSTLPRGRHNLLSDFLRKLEKYVDVRRMPTNERFLFFASLRKASSLNKIQPGDFRLADQQIFSFFETLSSKEDITPFLNRDLLTVLPCDMLYKVDSMSMANSLEVRVPFLDYELVHFTQNIPGRWKSDYQKGKIILRDTFGHLLPPNVTRRPKKGFEVPLLDWFRSSWKNRLDHELNKDSNIVQHGWIDSKGLESEKKQLQSNSPGDSAAFIWNLLVLENWYKRYYN